MGFLKILSNLKKYDTTAPFKPWARRIMINTLINEYKKEKVLIQNIQYVEQYYETEDFSEMSTAVSRIDHQQIYHFIEQLPPATQQVFNLYFVDGYKHREIAELLEITEGTSKWHLNSAKEKLKTMLRESNISIKAS